MESSANPDGVQYYEIRIEGHLDDARACSFTNMCVTIQQNGQTLIAGNVVDQAALFGILIRIRDMGIPLVSVIHPEHISVEKRSEQR